MINSYWIYKSIHIITIQCMNEIYTCKPVEGADINFLLKDWLQIISRTLEAIISFMTSINDIVYFNFVMKSNS